MQLVNRKITDSKSDSFLKYMAIVTIISVACYITLIANGLTNSMDGLWHTSYYQAGNWELGEGRWAWLFMDKVRGGYSAEPFNSLLSILLMACGTFFLIVPFGYKKHHILYALLVMISTTTCCYLSYRFQSPTFGASYFFATGASLITISYKSENRKSIAGSVLIVAIFIAISLGLYQANIGCFVLIVIGYSMHLLLHNRVKLVVQLLFRGLVSLIIGCTVYKLMWDLALYFRHTSASNYLGAGSISVLYLFRMLPSGVLKAYTSFVGYFSFSEGYYVFRIIRCILFVALFVGVLAYGIVKTGNNGRNCLLYIVLWLLVPLAANFFHLLAPESQYVMVQMTGPMSIVIPLILCITEDESNSPWVNYLCIILGIVFLYGNIYAVGTDLDALEQGSRSSKKIVENVVGSIVNDKLYDSSDEYLFVGDMADSPLFRKNRLWDRASAYAKFGNFGYEACTQYDCYNGVLDDVGISLKLGSYEKYLDVLKDTNIKNAPNYPYEGSIIRMGNLVIVKISDDIGVE